MATGDTLTPTAEQEAAAERTQEALEALLGLPAEKLIIDHDPTPMVVQRQEGCVALSDVGELEPVDAEGWYEEEKASVIVLVRRARGVYPLQEHDEIVGVTVRPDCPPYRVLKTLIDNGISL